MHGQRENDAERTEDREPDPARSYERAKPEKEAGMGRLDDAARGATPTDRPDRTEHAVPNVHSPRQLNAEEAIDASAAEPLGGAGPSELAPRQPPDHAMLQEEPLGEDLVPTDIHDPWAKRHPRKAPAGDDQPSARARKSV